MCIGVKVSDSLELDFSDSCELLCECWELNPGPLEEQSVLLTTEPSLQPHDFFFKDRVSLCSLVVLELTL